MKSPFPGMDPYLESTRGLWEGFHDRLIARIDDALSLILPSGYRLERATRSYVVLLNSDGKDEHLAKADLTITEPTPAKRGSKKKGGVAVADSDESLPMQSFAAEKLDEQYLEIYAEQEDRILVTCLEVLSPANKRPKSEGWNQYTRKRQMMLLGHANLVEIDLLRGGQKMPMDSPWPKSPYRVLVARSERTPHCRVWPCHFRRRLPVIPVPLGPGVPDLSLDLQPLIDMIYERWRYFEEIDYATRLTPALEGDDAAWVKEALKGHPSRATRKSPSA